jgi:hydroxyacylglutathione hydrolase
MLEVVRMTFGPFPNNIYILADKNTRDAVVIDPSFESKLIFPLMERKNWHLKQIWCTHGHFDHVAGVAEIANAFDPQLPIGLHPDDAEWYENVGEANEAGYVIEQPPAPSITFFHGQELILGQDNVIKVIHIPGHSPGHVMFYSPQLAALFCGDVMMREGLGRTDLPGSDKKTLINNIREHVFSLPDETRILAGHRLETTVGHEKKHNPDLM